LLASCDVASIHVANSPAEVGSMRAFVRSLMAVLALSMALVVPVTAQAAPPGHDRATVVSETHVGPRLVDLVVDSPALDATVPVRLLTPVGWDSRRPGQHWPTLWLLAGCCGDYTAWTARTDVASSPELDNVLVVMPEGGGAGFYSDWRDGGPAWETFHLTELRGILEHGYGAGPDRTVAGLSMGGFGALSYTARHPGMFRAAASYSGVVHPLYEPGGPANIDAILTGQGFDPAALWGDPVAQRRIWAAHDPYYLAWALRSVPLFLSSGDGTAGPFDQPGATSAFETLFLAQNESLAQKLAQVHARHVVTDFYGAGTHSWPYWQRELHRSLPMLLKAMHVTG
jgi:diacylglycerol O-acyltransferase / trehalose O-mycolyltransferase / mycolyltransferase Ag85